VSATSLGGGEKSGWLKKQGGEVRTWKKRYFILKGKHIYYYKGPREATFKGRIDLDASSSVSESPIKQSDCAFSVNTSKRIFIMYPEPGQPQQDKKEWMDAINAAIKSDNSSPAPTPTVPDSKPKEPQNSEPSNPTSQQPKTSDVGAPRRRLEDAKQAVSFLKETKSKVYEFWAIWADSIPPKSELMAGGTIEFYVACSANMEKLTWRTNGPQSIFIQKMVDFFWNVGAPEDEIDRLNDVGALINPVRIGSWIDMSKTGGMDGGWYFPVDIPLRLALEAADQGNAIREFGKWADERSISNAYAVGRDMGAAPPRQTEIRFKLPGNTPQDQVDLGLEAFSTFRFPPLPQEALTVLKQAKIENTADAAVGLSVITSSEGFVRMGLLVPRPSREDVQALCRAVGTTPDSLMAFETTADLASTEGPLFVEYQFLQKPFGYGVYKEGFDIVFHYRVGIEEQ